MHVECRLMIEVISSFLFASTVLYYVANFLPFWPNLSIHIADIATWLHIYNEAELHGHA